MRPKCEVKGTGPSCAERHPESPTKKQNYQGPHHGIGLGVLRGIGFSGRLGAFMGYWVLRAGLEPLCRYLLWEARGFDNKGFHRVGDPGRGEHGLAPDGLGRGHGQTLNGMLQFLVHSTEHAFSEKAILAFSWVHSILSSIPQSINSQNYVWLFSCPMTVP